MTGILLTTVLLATSGQAPADNFAGTNLYNPGSYISAQGLAPAMAGYYGGPATGYYPTNFSGYPASYVGYPGGGYAPGGFGFGIQCSSCPQGACYPCLGTYIGAYPTGPQCLPGFPDGPQAGGFAAPMYLPNSLAKSVAEENKEINRRLDEIRNTLDKDVKGTLDKLTESLKQMEKRLENTEKLGLSTEAKVEWIKEKVKEKFFWDEMEQKLDQRIKPLEEKLREIGRKLERRADGSLKPAPESAAGEEILRGLDARIDKVLSRLEQLDRLIVEERILRQKIEDRLKNIPGAKEELKDVEPKKKDEDKKEDKEIAPKDKENSARLAPVKTAAASRVRDAVPANKALVVVLLPADAKLFLNNQPTVSTGRVRTFITPELEPRANFKYTFRMEIVEKGRLRTQTQEITFQAGRRVTLTFGANGDTRVATYRK